jgi:Na+/H+ antiporter NhaC
MGGVDAVVNLGINTIDVAFPLGIFLIASFLSTATGTSVGAIVAIGPIAVLLADKAEPLCLNFRSFIRRVYAGDNLSMISDTTIAATQSLGCDLKINLRSICLLLFQRHINYFSIFLLGFKF